MATPSSYHYFHGNTFILSLLPGQHLHLITQLYYDSVELYNNQRKQPTVNQIYKLRIFMLL